MRSLSTLLLIILGCLLFAQDQVVFEAMTDELNRNLQQLERDDNKPFYISYSLSDVTTQTASAFLGSLLFEDEQKVKGWNARVMVGDYHINDENYSDEGSMEVSYLSYPNIPLEDDYHAIRRFFWIATNNIFEEANRLYKSKKENLGRYNLNYKVPDFDTVATSEIYIENEIELVDMEAVKVFIKSLSARFNDFDDILRCEVSWSSSVGHIYFVNSEGIKYKIPHHQSLVRVSANYLDERGQLYNDEFQFIENDPQDVLNQKEQIESRILEMIEALRASAKDEVIDLYYGPAVLTGDLSPLFFASNFSQGQAFTAERSPLSISSKVQAEAYFKSLIEDHQKEVTIASSSLSIYALPKATHYDGQELIGTVLIDGEGVVPPDTVLVVKDGKLLEKLASRTPGAKSLRSNGHNLNHISGGNLFKTISPSNLAVESAKRMDEPALKAQLLQQVESLGLDYGLMIQPAYEGSIGLVQFTKVFLDGNEVTTIGILPALYQNNGLRKVIGTSNQQLVMNNPLKDEFSRPYSIIAPSQVLINGFEISGSNFGYADSYLPSIPMPGR